MLQSIAIQVLPENLDDNEVIRVVDTVIDYIKSTGLNYYVGPCETSIESESIEELFEVMKNCMLIAGKENPRGVQCFMKASYRPDGEVLTIEKKVTKHH